MAWTWGQYDNDGALYVKDERGIRRFNAVPSTRNRELSQQVCNFFNGKPLVFTKLEVRILQQALFEFHCTEALKTVAADLLQRLMKED